MLMLCSLFWEGGSASKTLQEWAKIIRENPKKTEKILDYLASHGIAEIDLTLKDKITVINRRLVKDQELRELRKESGSLGGNPKLTTLYNKPGYIYAVKRENDGAVKIGIALNPENRINKIRYKERISLEILLTQFVDDMGKTEHEIHEKYINEKIIGEWFNLSQAQVNDLISTLKGKGKGTATITPPFSVSDSVSVSNHKQKEAKKMVFLLPDWIKKDTWEAYREMRQRKRAPLTDRASALIIKELEKLKDQGNPPEDVLNQSIMKSWTGVFPISRGGDGDGNRSGNYRGSGVPYPQTGKGQDDRQGGLGIPKEYKPEHLQPISEEDRQRNLKRLSDLTK